MARRPLARSVSSWLLALALCGQLGASASRVAAQAKADDEFSLDEDGAAPPAAPPAAAPEGEPELLGDEQALAEEQAPDEVFRESTDPYEDPKKHYFFVGAAWRYVRMPKFVLNWFLDAAPSLGTAGSFFGEFGYRKNGFQVTAEVGWMNWNFTGPFQLAGDPVTDTEWLETKFDFLMATATLTWSTAFTDWFALEYGVEGGFAALFGNMIRSEAYRQDGKWHKCQSWANLANPNWTMGAPTQEQVLYCDVPLSSGGGLPPATNSADEIGAHYNVKAERGLINGGVPRAMPVLGPRLSLRFKPIHQLVIRVDVPLPVAPFGFVGGLAAHFGF